MSITVFPSVDGWITPRTDEVQLTDQNCKIIVSKPIDYLTKILMSIDGKINVSYESSASYPVTNIDLSMLYYDEDLSRPIMPIDITGYVVEFEKYKTLAATQGSVFTTPTKLNTWPYTTKTNEIILPNTTPKWYEGLMTTTERLILAVLYSLEMQNGNLYGNIGTSNNPSAIKITSIHGLQQFTTADIMNARFRVYYEPLGESVKLNTLKTEPVKNEFAIPFSQQQQIVNNLALGKNMQATTNRTGVEQRTICRKVNKIDKIRPIGSFWVDNQKNKWRLTAQNIDFSCGYANCTETWSKNWAMQSEFVGINREFRSWNIPADTVERNILVEDYCYITTGGAFNGGVSHLTDRGKQVFMKMFDTAPSDTNTEITQLAIQTRDIAQGNLINTKPKGVATVSAFGFGNSLVVSATTKDNLSIGIQRAESEDDGGETKRYCKDVYYTDENGEIGAVDLTFGNTLSNLDTDLYPQTTISGFDGATENKNTIEQENDLIHIYGLRLEKDASEKLSFTYQMHFVCYDNDIIVGTALSANCPLVKNKESENLKYWVLDKPLPQGAQVMTSEFGREVPRNQVVGGVGSNYVQLYYKRCITDANNNIIVANNNFDFTAKIIYFNFTNDYNAIQQHYESNNGSYYRDAIAN